jgi:hypothetical protein
MTKGNNSDPGEIDPEELQHQLAHMGAPLTPNVVNRGVGDPKPQNQYSGKVKIERSVVS